MKQSKKETWLSFISSLTDKTPQSVLWNKIKKINGGSYGFQTVAIRKPDDTSNITNPVEIANIFAKSFANVSNFNRSRSPSLSPPIDPHNINTNSRYAYNDPISTKEV